MAAIESTTLQHENQHENDLVEIVVKQEPNPQPLDPLQVSAGQGCQGQASQASQAGAGQVLEKTIDVIMKDDAGESHIGTFRIKTTKCPERLFEIASHRRLACTRLILYQMDTLVASLIGTTFSSFPDYMQSVLRLGVSLSNVFLFSLVDKIPTEDDRILLAFTEFTDNEDEIALDLYETSLREINTKSAAYIQEEKQIDPDNEAPVQYKPAFVVNLDKTVALSLEDAKHDAEKRKDEPAKMSGDFDIKMSEDLMIGGPMAVINKKFFNKMKVREGAYEFLAELVKISDGQVYFLTAADIHYARAAVGQANEKYWITDSPYENKPDKSSDKFEPVQIPITHVFSTRHQEKHALPKTFERVIPYWPFLQRQQQTHPSTIRVFGIDDDLKAWDENCRDAVFQVPPCKPGYNDPSELLSILEQIKKRL
jgi:hypothetical protein